MPPSESLKEQFFKEMYQRLKECIRNRNYTIRDTWKNSKTVAYFGWTIQDQEDVLLNLDSASFQKVDSNRDDSESNEPVYFFCKMYNGRMLYIKITFRILKMPDGQTDFADIMSLHISDYDA